MARLQLIPEWRRAWRMGSVIASALLAFLSAVQAELLPIVQPLVSPERWPVVSGALALLIIVLRVIMQPAVRGDDPAQAAGRDSGARP